MAETTYRIIIENKTDDSENTPVSVDSTSETNATKNKAPKEKEQKADWRADVKNALVSVGNIKPYIMQAASFKISMIQMETGSADMQRRWQAYSSIGSSAVTIAGAAMMGGPTAAATTAATMAVQAIFQMAMNEKTNQLQKQMEAENLSLSRSRLGLSVNQSRMGGTV